MMSTLRNHGIEKIDPTGELFDANDHEVTGVIPAFEDGIKDNQVINVERKGFKLHGRLLRAARVQIAKNMKKTAEEKK